MSEPLIDPGSRGEVEAPKSHKRIALEPDRALATLILFIAGASALFLISEGRGGDSLVPASMALIIFLMSH